MTSDEDLRDAAKSRIKQQRGFWTMLGGFVILWIICWGIWGISVAASDAHIGHFWNVWPIWVMFGTGIAIVLTGWSAFGPRQGEITDEQIDAEVRKMKGQ